MFSDHILTLGKIDALVGLEARGFVIGAACAYKLGIPFVPIRKKGKLPGKVISYKYELEYGRVKLRFFLLIKSNSNDSKFYIKRTFLKFKKVQ